MNQRGVTLIELLLAVVIGLIAFFPLAMPFVGERSLFSTGKRQTEAQRDAEIVLRAMARVARQSTAFTIPSATQIDFTDPAFCGGATPRTFEVHPGGTFHLHDCNGNTVVLINGIRSQVATFVPTAVSSRLVDIQLQVTNRLTSADPRQRSESVSTKLFLRNAP